MKKKSSIIKLSLVGVAIIIGLVFAFCPFKVGLKDYNGYANKIKLGLDLKGGVYAVYEAESDGSGKNFDDAMKSTIDNLEQILTGRGYTEATVVREGDKKIRVSVPDLDNPQDILKILGSPAEIIFRLSGTGENIITGKDVSDAQPAYDEAGNHIVSLSLNSSGASKFAQATGNNVGQTMDIIRVDSEGETVISSPTINEMIAGGKVSISGMGSRENAETLAQQIRAGKFSLKLTQREVSTVSATLGESALRYGLIAGAIGIFLIILIILFLYRLFGAASAMALLCYTVLLLFILSVFPWVQLTLPGIAGVLLSIGMAIDGNIIISERIKDEYRNGKSILSSLHYGYRKSISAIVDGNITTVLASIVLLILGTGPIQGFATTLLIGILLSMFSSLVLTKFLMNCMVRLNQSNPELYNLKRGDGFEELEADKNDAKTEIELLEKEQKKAEKKKSQESPQGGNI